MNIYQAINAAMGEIEPIAKASTNQQQGFKYRGIDDIMNEIQSVIQKNGIFIVPTVLDMKREERQTKNGGNLLYSVLTIKFTFFSADGTSVDAVVIGEGMDSGDKASNKAMSVGLKYAILQVFCIPTAEAKDPDAESHDTAPRKDEAYESAKKYYLQLLNEKDENNIPLYNDAWRKKWDERLKAVGLRVTIAEMEKDQGVTK